MMHSFRIVLVLSAEIVLSAIWHTVFHGIEKRGLFRLGKRRLFTVILTLDLQRFIHKYRVSFLLLDSSAFTPQYLTSDRWRRQHQPAVSEAVSYLEKGNIPALAQVSERCSVLQTEGLILWQAKYILDTQK